MGDTCCLLLWYCVTTLLSKFELYYCFSFDSSRVVGIVSLWDRSPTFCQSLDKYWTCLSDVRFVVKSADNTGTAQVGCAFSRLCTICSKQCLFVFSQFVQNSKLRQMQFEEFTQALALEFRWFARVCVCMIQLVNDRCNQRKFYWYNWWNLVVLVEAPMFMFSPANSPARTKSICARQLQPSPSLRCRVIIQRESASSSEAPV